MNRVSSSFRESGLAREIAFFALYFVVIGLGLYIGLVIWRLALEVVFFDWLAFTPWVARFLYMVSVVLGAFALLAGILVAEPYLNTGKQRGELVRRFVRVVVPMLVIGLVGYLILLSGRL
jgi:hypothetical protein